eukprot:14965965-Alexandrium_andersonii.AAC.1
MSASLVGSEMCIRDSCEDMAHGGPSPYHWHKQGQDAHSWPVWCVVCVASVSYTHLTLPTICSV